MPTLTDSNIHYVKFLRGSITAWQKLLSTPDKIDDDTLYFIYETSANPREGKLYLGQKLISGSSSSIGGDINISDLADIFIDNETLQDKQILVYNETSNEWQNASLEDIISEGVNVFNGATELSAGTSGLVPAPQPEDRNSFLKGDGTWATINVPTFDSNAFVVNNNIVTIAGFTAAPVGSLPVKTNAGIEWSTIGAGTITRQIITADELDTIISAGTADANTIYMVLTDGVDSSNKYNEYLVVNGAKELVGTIGDVNLSDYVTNSVFQSTVGDINNILQDTVKDGQTVPGLVSKVTFLETKVGDLNNLILSEGNTTLVEEVNTLGEKLKWHELVEN